MHGITIIVSINNLCYSCDPVQIFYPLLKYSDGNKITKIAYKCNKAVYNIFETLSYF